MVKELQPEVQQRQEKMKEEMIGRGLKLLRRRANLVALVVPLRLGGVQAPQVWRATSGCDLRMAAVDDHAAVCQLAASQLAVYSTRCKPSHASA